MTAILESGISASITESAENGAGLQLQKIKVSMSLDGGLAEALRILINEDVEVEADVWSFVAGYPQWENMDHSFLLDVVAMVIHHKHSPIVVDAILSTNKFAIEHFEEMYQRLDNANLHAVNSIFRKMDDNGKWFGDGNWWNLAIRFAEKSLKLLQETTDENVLKELALSERWRNLHPWFGRIIALLAFDHEHGHLLLEKIIPLNLLHLEDYQEHSWKLTHPHLKWSARLAIYSAIRDFNRWDYDGIMRQLVPPVELPPINKRCSTLPPLEIVDGRVKTMSFPFWHHVMNSKPALRH